MSYFRRGGVLFFAGRTHWLTEVILRGLIIHFVMSAINSGDLPLWIINGLWIVVGYSVLNIIIWFGLFFTAETRSGARPSTWLINLD